MPKLQEAGGYVKQSEQGWPSSDKLLEGRGSYLCTYPHAEGHEYSLDSIEKITDSMFGTAVILRQP